jgi:hypothetical protein
LAWAIPPQRVAYMDTRTLTLVVCPPFPLTAVVGVPPIPPR